MNVRIIYFCMSLLSCCIFVTGCQTEDTYVKSKSYGINSGVTIKHLKGMEAKKAENLLKRELGKKGGLQLGTGQSTLRPEDQIDYNNILLVLDTLGIKNYTYKIVNHPDDNYKTFHNLVLTEKDNIVEIAVMKYEMTDLFAQDYSSFLKTFYEFEGTITAKGYDLVLDPCDEVEIDYPVTDPGSGGGGSGGGNPPTEDPGSGSPGSGSSGGGSTSVSCVNMTVNFVCSCGRFYDSWGSYTSSFCGDGTNPNGYTITMVVSYNISNDCRDDGPCIPGGVIGVVSEDDDCNTSKEDIMNAFSNISETNAEILAQTINDYGAEYGINNNHKLRHFLSQIAHETGGLSNLNISEDLNYTTSARLIKCFPKRFSYTDPNKENPDEYIGDPEKIGSLIYCCRMGNGDVLSQDGYKYRGRGLIQLTGKNNYQNFQNFYNERYENDIDIINNPDIVSTNQEVAIISAMWYFQNQVINKTNLVHNINEPVREITKKINGGLNGLSDRTDYYNNCVVSIECYTE